MLQTHQRKQCLDIANSNPVSRDSVRFKQPHKKAFSLRDHVIRLSPSLQIRFDCSTSEIPHLKFSLKSEIFPRILLYYPSNFLSGVAISRHLNRFGPGQGHRLCQRSRGELWSTLGDSQERPETRREPNSPMQPQFQQCLEPLRALRTGLASSRAAPAPSKGALGAPRSGTAPALPPPGIPTQVAAQEIRTANTCASPKAAARGCCIKRACPPRSSSRACERRGAAAKAHGSAFQLLNQLLAAQRSAGVSCRL